MKPSSPLVKVFPLVALKDEHDAKSLRAHRMKMEVSGHSLEDSLDEEQVENLPGSKVDWG